MSCCWGISGASVFGFQSASGTPARQCYFTHPQAEPGLTGVGPIAGVLIGHCEAVSGRGVGQASPNHSIDLADLLIIKTRCYGWLEAPEYCNRFMGTLSIEMVKTIDQKSSVVVVDQSSAAERVVPFSTEDTIQRR